MSYIENREELWLSSRQKRQISVVHEGITPGHNLRYLKSPLACQPIGIGTMVIGVDFVVTKETENESEPQKI